MLQQIVNRLILLLKVVGVTPSKEDKTKYTLKIPLASLPLFKKEPKRSRNWTFHMFKNNYIE